MAYKLGLLQSPLDTRDYIYGAVVPPVKVSLPEEYLNWLEWATPVQYQAELGSCAAFTGVAAAELLNFKELKQPVDLSEQFLYGEAKKVDGIPNEEGTYLRAILRVLRHTGICEEQYLPYEGKYPPSKEAELSAYTNATKYRIKSYASVLPDKDAIRRAIFQSGPLLAGIKVYENFEEIGADGLVSSPLGRYLGGHAIPLLAYNKIGVISKNSWSTKWGNSGYCTIPWNVLGEISMEEIWSIVDSKTSEKCGVINYIKCFLKQKGGIGN